MAVLEPKIEQVAVYQKVLTPAVGFAEKREKGTLVLVGNGAWVVPSVRTLEAARSAPGRLC